MGRICFGIPGAKIDYLFNALIDDGPELIVTRHEQNAANDGARYWKINRQTGCSNLLQVVLV